MPNQGGGWGVAILGARGAESKFLSLVRNTKKFFTCIFAGKTVRHWTKQDRHSCQPKCWDWDYNLCWILYNTSFHEPLQWTHVNPAFSSHCHGAMSDHSSLDPGGRSPSGKLGYPQSDSARAFCHWDWDCPGGVESGRLGRSQSDSAWVRLMMAMKAKKATLIIFFFWVSF